MRPAERKARKVPPHGRENLPQSPNRSHQPPQSGARPTAAPRAGSISGFLGAVPARCLRVLQLLSERSWPQRFRSKNGQLGKTYRDRHKEGAPMARRYNAAQATFRTIMKPVLIYTSILPIIAMLACHKMVGTRWGSGSDPKSYLMERPNRRMSSSARE